MSKSLRSIKSQDEKIATIYRRVKSNTKGLGYWAAIDAMNRLSLIPQIPPIHERNSREMS